jgi:putative Ca2+/H+ antiporter (TMEM165/GDT1 family)
MPDAVADPTVNRIVSTLADFPARTDRFGLFEVGPKQVWIAVCLALAFGPFGLLYCTNTGTMVMLIVSVPLAIFLGKASFLIIQPICAIWAWRAARDLSSTFD